ncbi:MAG: YfhO family protein [Clostridia bacterium]|nr:YfhO family protein [Clostridia bacterium]
MDENMIPTDCTPEASHASATQKSRLRRLLSPLDGMHHIWLAFLFPVVIMALIYVAMEVWPFGKNSVLVLDLNGQYVYYFEAMRDIFRGEQGILYSFERALGGEFLGIVAYYLASPFTVITALFPEGMITESLYTILLLKCGLSGLNMCVYLHKSHPTKPVNEVIFSVIYALTSYAVVMQHNTMWIDCLLFFPLIMLGIESLIKYGRYKLYVLTLATAVFSNYYIGYMVCFGVAAYFFFYYFMSTPKERNPLGERGHFIKTFGRMALYSVIAVGMAALIILPAYYSLTFGKTTFSDPSYDFKQRFDFLDLISKMFPASYDTVRPEGLPFVFSGTLTLIMLPVFFFIKQITPRKKIAYGAMMAFFIFSFNSSTIDLIWHGFQRPNWLNYRYSFMFCFIIIAAAYLAFEHIAELDMRTVLGVGAGLGLILVLLQKLEYENLDDLMGIWFGIACIAVYMILLSGCNKKWLEGSISSILCVFVLLELFCNGLAEVVSLDSDVHYSSRTSYRTFMDKWSPAADWVSEYDTSFYRAEKTTHRKTNDNFALNIRGLSNSTSTLNAEQIDFLQDMGYASKSHWSKYLGGTPVSDSLLGVKYLLANDTDELNDLWGEAVWTDEDNLTVVYKNDYVLPLGYMVASGVSEIDLDEYDSPFERMNELVTEMLGEEETVELFKPYKNLTPATDNLDIAYVTGHRKYEKLKTGYEGKLTYEFTPVNDYELFVYFPTDYKRDATLKLNGNEVSEYFTNETHRIVSLGSQPAGEPLVVTLTLGEDDIYLGTGTDYFCYLDEELFREIMPRLQKYGYNIESFTDSSFTGTVTVPEDRTTFLLTIPYDEGWKVYVDGELCETAPILEALTAVELDAGEHKIELRYRPKYVTYGIIISAVSHAALVAVIACEQLVKHRRRAAAAAEPMQDA